jgi:hypothetical protein
VPGGAAAEGATLDAVAHAVTPSTGATRQPPLPSWETRYRRPEWRAQTLAQAMAAVNESQSDRS